MRGRFRFTSQDSVRYAEVYLRWIASEFRSLDSGVVTTNDSRLTIRGGTFGPRRLYSLFTAMNSGCVAVIPGDLGVEVQFEFEFPDTVAEGGIAFCAAAAAAITSDQIGQFFLGVVAVVVGFNALLHHGLARSRLERTLRAVAKRVERTEQESRAELGGTSASGR
jgi:hypothetical protein